MEGEKVTFYALTLQYIHIQTADYENIDGL